MYFKCPLIIKVHRKYIIFMNFYTKISITYDCEVAKGGYLLQSSVIKTSKSISYSNYSYRLTQKIKKQIPRSKPFTAESLEDFIYVSKFLRSDRFNDLLLRFYNKWGPLIKIGESFKITKKLFQLIEDSEFAKQNMEYPPYDFGSDLISKKYQEIKWDYDDTGELHPSFHPKTLFNAISLAWGLNQKDKKPRSICKYYKFFGNRKNCQQHFEITRDNKEFCSRDCSNAFRQKPNWQEKVHNDLIIRIKKTQAKFNRVNLFSQNSN